MCAVSKVLVSCQAFKLPHCLLKCIKDIFSFSLGVLIRLCNYGSQEPILGPFYWFCTWSNCSKQLNGHKDKNLQITFVGLRHLTHNWPTNEASWVGAVPWGWQCSPQHPSAAFEISLPLTFKHLSGGPYCPLLFHASNQCACWTKCCAPLCSGCPPLVLHFS